MKEIIRSSEYKAQLRALLYFTAVADVLAIISMVLLDVDLQLCLVSLLVGNIYMWINFTWLFHSAYKASFMDVSQGLIYMSRTGRLRFLATALFLTGGYLLFAFQPIYLVLPLLYFKYMNYFNAIRRK